MKRISLLLLLLAPLLGCTKSDESGKIATPPTVFDDTQPDPRSDEVKIVDFTMKMELKYKREDTKNAIDLHFTTPSPHRVKVKLTYSRDSDPTLVTSIADAAMELAKRLKREDPSVRNLDIDFERDVTRRE